MCLGRDFSPSLSVINLSTPTYTFAPHRMPFGTLAVVHFDEVAESLSVSRRAQWRRKAASTSNSTSSIFWVVSQFEFVGAS